jgi:zinc and cadmium transporter
MGMILPILILLLGPLSGILVHLFLKVKTSKIISFTVIFSGSFLLGISLFGLMPELFDNLEFGHIQEAGLWIVTGFLLQIILEKFTGGLGHGHIHSHDIPKNELVLFGGLMLHALFEGYSAGLTNYLTPGLLSGMIMGIAIHEIPAAFSLSVLMTTRYHRKRYLLPILGIYACATPFGYLLGVFVHKESIISEHMSHIITAIIAGTFLHISTTIVFENSLWKKEGLKKWGMILLGLTISYFACLAA